jgi:hypothetical protein
MSPTPGEKKMREEVIRRISSVISTVWPYAEVQYLLATRHDLDATRVDATRRDRMTLANR